MTTRKLVTRHCERLQHSSGLQNSGGSFEPFLLTGVLRPTEEVTDGHVEEKNGRRMGKGKCPECGTTVVRILGKAS